jgi:hypothetical protein
MVLFSSSGASIASISIHEDYHPSEVSHFWIASRILAFASAGSSGNGAKSDLSLGK